MSCPIRSVGFIFVTHAGARRGVGRVDCGGRLARAKIANVMLATTIYSLLSCSNLSEESSKRLLWRPPWHVVLRQYIIYLLHLIIFASVAKTRKMKIMKEIVALSATLEQTQRLLPICLVGACFRPLIQDRSLFTCIFSPQDENFVILFERIIVIVHPVLNYLFLVGSQ